VTRDILLITTNACFQIIIKNFTGPRISASKRCPYNSRVSFGEATPEEFHLSPKISKITSQVIEENVQSLTAPKASSVLQLLESLSAKLYRCI